MKLQRITFLLLAAGLLVAVMKETQTQSVTVGAQAELSEQTRFVALTFDDGPRADTTPRLLDGLRERGANATFFLVGAQLQGNEELVRRMAAEGHQVGNHTWNHVLLKGMTTDELEEEIQRTELALQEILNGEGYWVRPPYGLVEDGQRDFFTVPLVHWSVDPEDWKLRNADADVKEVLAQVTPGSIILMHDTVDQSVDAALRIVDALEAKGYEFITVQELFAIYGTTPIPGVLYHTADVWE